MKKLLVAALAALAASLAAPALAVDAAAIYGAKCVVCHGKDGAGSAAGKKMGAPDFKTLKESEKDMAAAIANGKGKMSAFKGKLTSEEIDAVAKYVKGGLK
jgi:cytochrome c6